VGTVGLIALLVLRPAADYNSLQTLEGLAYVPNASEPFEGKAVSHHPNDLRRTTQTWEFFAEVKTPPDAGM
jgi:hypothetical protein